LAAWAASDRPDGRALRHRKRDDRGQGGFSHKELTAIVAAPPPLSGTALHGASDDRQIRPVKSSTPALPVADCRPVWVRTGRVKGQGSLVASVKLV